MRQPRRSAEASDAIRASHSALINQLFKSPISASPPASLASKSSSFSKDCTSSELFDAIMLQNLFNDLDLVGRVLADDYRVERLSWSETPIPGPAPIVAVLLRFLSPNDTIVFDVHGYLTSPRDIVIIGKSGMLDPKTIVLQRRIHILCAPGSNATGQGTETS